MNDRDDVRMDTSIIEIWTDGSVKKKNVHDSRGTGRYGSVAEQAGESIWSKARLEDNLTNNEAEMKAILDALVDIASCMRVWASFGNAKRKPSMIVIYSDSQDVVSWIDGNFTCKAPNIKPLLASILSQVTAMSRINVSIAVKKIPREKNKAHDVVDKA